jgi:hypothetical protein
MSMETIEDRLKECAYERSLEWGDDDTVRLINEAAEVIAAARHLAGAIRCCRDCTLSIGIKAARVELQRKMGETS